MSEDRITALEELTAHQTKTIDELSEQLTEQWKVIDRMKRMLERLGERLENLDAGTGEVPVTKPPYY
jgi:SlyX protein